MVAVAATLLAACSGDDAGSVDSTTTSTVAPTTTIRPSDGTLVIGVVAPTGAGGNEIGASTSNAIDLAVREVNTQGGVNGQQIVVVSREEGDTATTERSVQELVDLGVDAIIGPTSSLAVLNTLDTAVDAGVLTCAPTASALALDTYPDNGLLIRTVPSDSLQASALARLVEESGNNSVTVVYLDDAFGRPFGDAMERALALEDTAAVDTVSFTESQDSIDDAVTAVVEADPGAVVVIADDSTGPAVIRAIDAATDGDISYFVNDAVRRPSATAGAFAADLAPRIFGASPAATAEGALADTMEALHPGTPTLFAQNAYDCLTLLAVGAAAAKSDDPSTIASAISALTLSGTSCSDFASCTDALDAGRNIDYDGPSGALSIGAQGDPISAVFDRFTFDESGRDVSLGRLVIDNG